MDLKSNCYAIAFYSFIDASPSGEEFGEYFNLFNTILADLDVSPTYYGVSGEGCPEKFIKSSNTSYLNKLKLKNFDHAHGFSLIVNPDNSDSPSYDHFIYLDIDYIEREGLLTIAIVINEAFISSFTFVQSLFVKFHDIKDIDYGYATIVLRESKPELPILGIESDYLDEDEKMSLYNWYDASRVQRKERIRYVYQYNFLNKIQLSNVIVEGCTVADYIDKNFDSNRFYEIDKTEIFILEVKNHEISSTVSDIREALI